jgi:hypothetical protein
MREKRRVRQLAAKRKAFVYADQGGERTRLARGCTGFHEKHWLTTILTGLSLPWRGLGARVP